MPMPLYQKGQRVIHISRGVTSEAIILAVHLDNDLKPYYTIRILSDGREKQTDNGHIRPNHSESIGRSQKVNGAYPVQEHNAHPVKEQIFSRGNIDSTFSSSEEDEGNSHNEKMGALPQSILRTSSYGATTYNGSNDEEIYYMNSNGALSQNVSIRGHDGEDNASKDNKPTSTKRKLDTEHQSNAASSKRVRFDPEYSVRTYVPHSDTKKVVTKVRARAKRAKTPRSKKKVPSLHRPPIDRHYFSRIRPKQKKVQPKVNLTSRSTNEGAIESRHFNQMSILYQDVTRKAHRVKLAKQRQKSRGAQNNQEKSSPKAPLEKNRAYQLSLNRRLDREQVSTQTDPSSADTSGSNAHVSRRQKCDSQTQTSLRPMITFAPERQTSSDYAHMKYGQNDDIKEPMQITRSSARTHRLPFEFMPVDDRANFDVKGDLVTESVLSFLRFVGGLTMRWMVVLCRACVVEQEPIEAAPPQRRNKTHCDRAYKPYEKMTPRTLNNVSARLSKQAKKSRPRDKSTHVKNPKDWLHIVPLGWETSFELQPEEWKCGACNFKNPPDTFTCDSCLAVKLDNRRVSTVKEDLDTSLPGAEMYASPMSCDTYTSVSKDDEEGQFPKDDSKTDYVIIHNAKQSISPLPETNDAKRSDVMVSISKEDEASGLADERQITAIIGAPSTSKKRATDHEDDVCQPKRIGLDHYSLEWLPAQEDSISEGMQLTQSNNKRFQEFCDDEEEGLFKRCGVDGEQTHGDLMDISPHKNDNSFAQV